MHQVHLVDLGWKIARVVTDSNPNLAYLELINPPTNACDCCGTMRLQPEQALKLANTILAHFTETPGGQP